MRIEFGVEWPESIEILDTNEFHPENIYDVLEGYWQFRDYDDLGQ